MAPEEPDFTMERQDPPRALPDSYREIANNIERVRMSASGEWFRIGMFPKPHQAQNRRLILKRRPEYKLFEFRAGKLEPPVEGFVDGLWCKWIGVKKPKKVSAPAEEDRKLRSV